MLKLHEHAGDRHSDRENDQKAPHQLRQSRHRLPLPEYLSREMNLLEPVETGYPKCGSDGEVSAEQRELASCALKVIRTVRVKKACVNSDCIV